MFVQEGSVECHLRLQHNAVCIFHIIGNTRLVFQLIIQIGRINAITLP